MMAVPGGLSQFASIVVKFIYIYPEKKPAATIVNSFISLEGKNIIEHIVDT